jgi:hypothetical protein
MLMDLPPSGAPSGAILIAGEASTGTWVRMAINYLVPFLVASVGYLGAHDRGRHR